jgi:hypothetical protein
MEQKERKKKNHQGKDRVYINSFWTQSGGFLRRIKSDSKIRKEKEKLQEAKTEK